MKDTGVRCILTVVLAILSLNACAGSPLKPSPPTATVNPTSAPTATVTPVPAPVLLGEYELLSPEDMRHDLDELFHRIETTHPDPYAKRPKEDIDQERRRIYGELDQPMTMIEFYKQVAPLVNSLGDYHTSLALPVGILGVLHEKELFFPFVVGVEKDRAYIVSNFSNNSDIETQSELLEVNGTSVTVILDLAKRFFPLESRIPPLVFLFLFGSAPEYQMEVIPPDGTAPFRFTIPSMASEQIERKASTSQTSVAQSNEPVAYKTLPEEKIGILTVNGFVGIGPLLKPAFVQFQKDDVEHLIIDIRANGGGKYEDVNALMNYLTDQPYRWCSRSYEAPFGGYGTGDIREVECELIQPFDSDVRFEGKLYLLIGPDTFSAAITLATVLQDMGLATLIGDETNDAASYCANVVLEGLELPRTGLVYWCSNTCYVRPSGILDDLPVVPDIFVETTIADQLAGQDPVLQSTLEMIRHSE